MSHGADWLSVPVWAAAHGVSVRTAWRWVESGKIAKRNVRRQTGENGGGAKTWIHVRALAFAPAPQRRGQRADAYGLSGK